MTRPTMLLAATMLSCLAATAPAQERHMASVLIIRCGPSDIILNQPLLEALLGEASLRDSMKEAFGEAFSGLSRMSANMPAAHAAGTFQVHLSFAARISGDWGEEQKTKAIDTVIDHIKKRLGDMLFKQPHRRLRERREALQATHAKVSTRLAELQAQFERSHERSTKASERFEALQDALHEARLQLATEERVREHLARTRDENVALRDHLRRDIRKRTKESEAANNELLTLIGRTSNVAEGDKEKLQKMIARLRKQLTSAEENITKWQEIAGDVQALLTVALEQLPLSELKLHRMKARVTSLEKANKAVEKEYKRLPFENERRQHMRAQIEHEEINLQVTRQQLIDVEGQLARLAPVRYEILRFQ